MTETPLVKLLMLFGAEIFLSALLISVLCAVCHFASEAYHNGRRGVYDAVACLFCFGAAVFVAAGMIVVARA